MFTMIQDFQSSSTLVEIKRNSEIFHFLHQHKIHLYDHEWKINEWNVKTIGFLPNFPPIHHPKDLATKALNMTFKHESMMPNFRLCKVTVTTTMFNTNFCIQVYAIEVQDKDIKAANRLLMYWKYPSRSVEFRFIFVRVIH
jgi:hypothetical protein